MQTCDIVIRSYWRDRDWLDLCLRSVERFSSGFREIVVAVPRASSPWFRDHDRWGATVRWVEVNDHADDYLAQQVTKLHADELTDADLICHLDSDCVLRRPTSPADLVIGGRPRVYTRPVVELGRHWPWTAPTEEFLGSRPTHDFMQCPPFTFPRWLYPEIRAMSWRSTGRSITDWVLSRSPRGFSEFNVLGAYAYAHHREAFVWVRAQDIGAEERVVDWNWSRDPIEPVRVAWERAHAE